jgi:hypothetical protein
MTDEELAPYVRPLPAGTEAPPERGWLDAVIGESLNFAKGAVWNTGKGIYETAKRIIEPPDPKDKTATLARAVAGPLGPVLTEMGRAHLDTAKKSVLAGQRGDFWGQAGYGVAALVPGMGPAAAAIGEKIGEGQVAEGLGDLAGMYLPLKAVVKGVAKRVPILPKVVNQNPAEVAAFEYMRGQGVEVPAGVATGNKAVSGIQHIVDHSPGGSIIAQNAKAKLDAGMTRVGNELAGRVNEVDGVPGAAVTPYQAGEGVTGKIETEIGGYHAKANEAYGELRALEADPVNTQRIQTGVKEVPSGMLDEGGNPIMKEVPVLEDMALPVDLRQAKLMLKPVVDQFKRQLPVSQQRASAGLHAMQNILAGPDFAPASVVDLDLGTIKGIARGADLPELKNLSQGLAAHTIQFIDDAVQRAVSEARRPAGPGAVARPVAAGVPSGPGASGAVPEAPAAAPASGSPGVSAGAPAASPAAVPVAVAGSGETVIRVPGEQKSYPARYELRELAAVRTSHKGSNFQPNPKYGLKNDRNYSAAENQGKVVEWSSEAQFDPAYHVTDAPDALNGAIVVDQAGNALAGNGRGMMLDRVYSANKGAAQRYRTMLEERAGQFGVDPAAVRGMKQPVLVRVVDDTGMTPAQKANAISDFNKKGTAELTPAERAIADSRRVSEGTLDDVSGRLEALGDEGTLAQVLEGRGGLEVLNKLIDDGIITSQERAALANEKGLTAAGRTRVNQLMLGRFFRDPSQLDNVPAIVRTRLERVAAQLARVETRGDWNLTPFIQDAVDLLEEAGHHGINDLDAFVRQDGLFGAQKYSPKAIAMAKHLQTTPVGRLTTAVRQYAQDAQVAAQGAGLFGEPISQAQAFADAFGGDAGAMAGSRPNTSRSAGSTAVAGTERPATEVDAPRTEPAGADAVDALQRGRMATSAKYDAAGILKQLRDEPRQVFDQAVWAKDAGIDRLREVARLAPEEMPKVGRAYLEELLETATAEGDFGKGKTIHNQWQKLGPQTKALLFRSPELIKDLDHFFLVAKRIGESPNPSGSALVGSLATGGVYMVMQPATGIPMAIGAAGLSKLMHSPAGVRALTTGLQIPVGKGAAASIAATNILRLAGDSARPAQAGAGPEQSASPIQIR